MKHLLPGLALLLFLSCSPDDSAGSVMQELAPVVSVDLPETMIHGSTNDIKVVFERRTNCHRFAGFDITHDNDSNVFIFGVTTTFQDRNNCTEAGNLQDNVILNFVAEREDFYIFKFWQGHNAAGEDEFLIKEVAIIQPGIE